MWVGCEFLDLGELKNTGGHPPVTPGLARIHTSYKWILFDPYK